MQLHVSHSTAAPCRPHNVQLYTGVQLAHLEALVQLSRHHDDHDLGIAVLKQATGARLSALQVMPAHAAQLLKQ